MARHPKYLTVEEFARFKENDFAHLVQRVTELTLKVSLNTKLLWVILGGLITAYIIERVFR